MTDQEIHGHDETDTTLAERMRLLAEQCDEEYVSVAARAWADEVEALVPAGSHARLLITEDGVALDFKLSFHPDLKAGEDQSTWPEPHVAGVQFLAWLAERLEATAEVSVEVEPGG